MIAKVHEIQPTGVDRIFFQLYDYTDLSALELLAQAVLPAVHPVGRMGRTE